LKVCPKDSQCSIEADIDNVSDDSGIKRVISINRIGTPALDAIAAREKASREKRRWAAVHPYMEKAEHCVVENKAKITEVTAQDVLFDGICSQEGQALRNQLIKQFSSSGHYFFMDYRAKLLGL
jgi:hypothetical protein